MNDNTMTNKNDTFTITMEVLDATTGELEGTIEYTFTREEIREECQKAKDEDDSHDPLRDLVR